jgi:hypothetical protein
MRNHPSLSALRIAALLLSVALLSPSPGFSREADFGVRGGVYSEQDQDEGFLGAEALFDITQGGRWFGNPNVEHVFADSGDLTSLSFDFHYDLPTGAPYSFWVGAGPTLIHDDRNLPSPHNTTDAGVNLLFGVGAKKGNVRPYGQVKAVLADDSQVAFGVGVRF